MVVIATADVLEGQAGEVLDVLGKHGVTAVNRRRKHFGIGAPGKPKAGGGDRFDTNSFEVSSQSGWIHLVEK